MITSIFAIVAPLAVGSVFLVTGIVKALAPMSFFNHIEQLRLLPSKLNIATAIIFTIFELTLGIALILRLFSHWVLPGTIILLLGLTYLTYWSISTGRTDNCGCYSGLIEVSPKQSLLLNALYIALIGFAWVHPANNAFTVLHQLTALLIALTISSLLTAVSYLYCQKKGKPILDLTVLRENRPWQSKWLPEEAGNLMTGSHLVVFLSPSCSVCKNWLVVLNLVHKRGDLPAVLGVVAGTPTGLEKFVRSHQLIFPVVAVSPSVMGRFVSSFPTAVVLENGIIRERWLGVIPATFIERIKQKESVLVK